MKNFLKNNKNTLIAGGGITNILIGLAIIKKCIYKVEPGFLAIKYNIFSGVGNKNFREGYHFNIPILERPLIYDCRMKKHMNVSDCGTKDLQIVTLKTRIVCRPKPDKLQELYRLLGFNYDERVLQNIIPEICGVALSKYNASQIISQRDHISLLIRQKIIQKASEYFIDVDDVAIIDIKFSPEFSDAIEKKQVAQQEAERMKFLVEQALEEKKGTIIKALGESEAVQKFGEANQNSDAFLILRRLETAKYISNILKKSENKVLLDTDSYSLNLPSPYKKV